MKIKLYRIKDVKWLFLVYEKFLKILVVIIYMIDVSNIYIWFSVVSLGVKEFVFEF